MIKNISLQSIFSYFRKCKARDIIIFLSLFFLIGSFFVSCSETKESKVEKVRLDIEFPENFPDYRKNNDSSLMLNMYVGEGFKINASVYPETLVNKNVFYSSSDMSVATVDDEGNVEFHGNGTVFIYAKSGNKTSKIQVNVYNHLTGAEFIKSQFDEILLEPEIVGDREITKVFNAKLGDKFTLSYRSLPEKGVNVTPIYNVYEKKDGEFVETNIIALNSDKVIAKELGEVYLELILAEDLFINDDGSLTYTMAKSDICKINVLPVPIESISFNKQNLDVPVGYTSESNLNVIITPSNATYKDVEFFSEDETIATIDDKCMVSAKKIGTTQVKVKALYGEKVATCNVTVTPVYARSILVNNNKTIFVEKNTVKTVSVSVLPSDTENKYIKPVSSNSNIAEAYEVKNGLAVKGIEVGSCILTVTAADGSGTKTTCLVQVISVPVQGITLDNTSLNLKVSETSTIKGTISPTNADVKDVVFKSENPEVATVDSNGKVIAKGIGSTQIIVTSVENDNISATCRVNVTATSVTGVSLNKSDLEIEVEDTRTLTATVAPFDATNKAIIWTSSDTSVATVEDGKITALKTGNATITVKTSDGSKTATCNVNVVAKYKAIKFISDKSFSITSKNGKGGKSWDGKIYYSTNVPSGTWNEWNGNQINSVLNDGRHEIYMRGADNTVITGREVNNTKISYFPWAINGENVSCIGDIRHLMSYDNVSNAVMSEYCFASMFADNSCLKTAPSLPFTKLAPYCYWGMFKGCSSLQIPPSLPATELEDYCYYAMFIRCTSMQAIPRLLATELKEGCYSSMFSGCLMLKFSLIQNDEYNNSFTLGVGVTKDKALNNMIANTSGTFNNTPSEGLTLWTSNDMI